MTYCYKVNNRKEYDSLIKYLHDNGAVWNDTSKLHDWTPLHVKRNSTNNYPIFIYNYIGKGFNSVSYGTNIATFNRRIKGEENTEHDKFVLATVPYKLKHRNIKE